jgi:hypothetical protein
MTCFKKLIFANERSIVMSKQNEKPIKDFRAGNCQASIWRQEIDQDGKVVVRHSVRIQKQYRNKEGNYENTEYFFKNDLPMLELIARKAFEFIALKESTSIEEEIPV